MQAEYIYTDAPTKDKKPELTISYSGATFVVDEKAIKRDPNNPLTSEELAEVNGPDNNKFIIPKDKIVVLKAASQKTDTSGTRMPGNRYFFGYRPPTAPSTFEYLGHRQVMNLRKFLIDTNSATSSKSL